MIKYEKKIFGVSDNTQFVKANGKKKRVEYIIYANKSAYPIRGVYARIFESIIQFKISELSEMRVSETALRKCLLYFLELDWIQEISGNKNVKLVISNYTYCTEINGNFYIVNFLYKTVDRISNDTYSIITNKEYEKLPSKDLFYLYTRKYLKDETVNDEICHFENQIDTKVIYIVFSYDCNLRCKYCFESRLSRDHQMTKEIFDRSVGLIDDLSIGNSVAINFFGGEPLLERNRERINEIFNQFKINNNVYFRFITNGVNIEQYIDAFEPIKNKIRNFVITLDGTKEIHDKRRLSIDSQGSFDAIINSICMLNKYNYPVSIRINIDKDNYDCQEELIHLLNRRIKKKSKISIEYHRVEDKANIDYKPTTYLDCYKLYKRIKKKSRFNVTFNLPIVALLSAISEGTYSFPKVKKSYCTLSANHVIDYDGQIYSCHEATGIEGFRIGTVEQEIQKSCEMAENIKCRSCVFYMGCYGGCPLENYYHMEHTGHNKCNCKQIMDSIEYFLGDNSSLKKYRIGKGV